MKFIKRVENHIIITHEKLIRGTNLLGVLTLVSSFGEINIGSGEFWRKIESLLV